MPSNRKTPEEQQRLRRFRRNLIRSLCGIGFVILLGSALSPYVKIGVNVTNSVNGYVFLIVKGVMPSKGELVAFWPPENEFFQRVWFVKWLKGTPGDLVERQGQAFYLNGEYVGDAKTTTKGGIALKPSNGGVIPPGHYFIWTPHADSFDSRYEQIGWISESSVIGRAYRIL